MVAKIRNLKYSPAFPQEYKTKFKNLLVSGGSYVWNNSEEHVCTWTYTLKDIAGFEEVYDCSQSGAGPGHVFNSIINEIETNKSLNPNTTLVILMFSDLSITDTITTKDMVKTWHHMGAYRFDENFSTITLFKDPNDPANPTLNKLCIDYAKHIDFDAQVLENMIKIKSLHTYLKDKKFQTVYLNWKKPVYTELNNYLDQIECLDDWTARHQMRIPNDGHPTPEAHLQWTRQILIPYLEEKQLIEKL